MENTYDNEDIEKEYVNKELYNLSYREFSDKFRSQLPETKSMLENLELALLYLNHDKIGHPMRFSEIKENVFNLNTFDGAWLIDVPKISREGEEDKNDVKFFAPLGALQATLDLFNDFNIKMFHWGNNNDDDKSITTLQKFRLLDIKETRHLNIHRNIFEERYAFLDKEDKWFTKGDYIYCQKVIRPDGHMVNAPVPICFSPNHYFTQKDVSNYIKTEHWQEDVGRLNMMFQIRLTAYYEWFVYFREDEKSLGIKIPVAPEASKEVFALRNIPEGQTRKKALCNFVKQHYRNIKINPDYDEEYRQVLVKQHLRGETKFNWRGLQVHIIPAEYDINRIKPKKKFMKV